MAKRIHKATDTQSMTLDNAVLSISLTVNGKTVGTSDYAVEQQTSKAGKPYYAASLKAKGGRYGVSGVAELTDGSTVTFGGANAFVSLPHADYADKPTTAPTVDPALLAQFAAFMAAQAKPTT